MHLGIADHLGWAVVVAANPDGTVADRWPTDFPTDIAVQRRVSYESRADALMYRQTLAAVAHARGWTLRLYEAKTVERDAVSAFGNGRLVAPRSVLGAPWVRDHRVAYAAALVAAL